MAQTKSSTVSAPQLIEQWLQGQPVDLLDVRSEGEFASGSLPGAINLPVSKLVKDGRLVSLPELASLFASVGISTDAEVVTTCGSGVTAAIITLALDSVGHTRHRLYDGSWSQWGGRDDTPVRTG